MRRPAALPAAVLLTAALGLAAAPAAAAATPQGTTTIGTPVTVGTAGNEPIVMPSPDGTLYVSALQHLYVSHDDGRTWAPSPGTPYNTTLNVASDSSISIDPTGKLYFTFDYPYAGTTAVCTSTDKAATFACDQAATFGGTDRMWVLAGAPGTSYEVTNEALYQTIFLKSTDGGVTYTPVGTAAASAASPTDGPLLQHPGTSAQVLQVYVDNASNATATTNEQSGPIRFRVFPSAGGVETLRSTPLIAGAALPTASYGSDGTLYAATETPTTTNAGAGGTHVTVARSGDDAQTWTVLPDVPGTDNATTAFTAVAAGAPGHVGVLYYRTSALGLASTVPADASWDVVYAETANADAASPTWSVQTLDRDVHRGPVCASAGCTGNARFSGDFIWAQLGSDGEPHLVWNRELPGGAVQVRYAGAAADAGPAPVVPQVPFAPLLPVAAVAVLGAGTAWTRRRRSPRLS